MSILNSIFRDFPLIQNVGEGGIRSGVVHRLDYETSGVLIFALSDESWKKLRTEFEEKKIQKTYHALVHGIPTGPKILNPKLRVVKHHPAYVAEDSDGYSTELSWKIIKSWKKWKISLIEIDLKTGFLHQIRATFHNQGNSILGDKTYFSDESKYISEQLLINRQMLHCYRIVSNSCDIDVISPYHSDFESVVDTLNSKNL